MLTQLPMYGALAEAGLPGWIIWATFTVLALAAGFVGLSIYGWAAGTAAMLWLLGAPVWLWLLFAPTALVACLPILRRRLVTDHLFTFVQKAQLLPKISETEQQAIEAGNVWIDAELFSGRPNLDHLSNVPFPELSAEERAFLEGPVREVCAMTDDWRVSNEGDLPEPIWDYLKQNGFFGMIIPKEFGGLGFSATAHSAVVQQLASRSLALAITVMVPNSLGPAELILHSGTEEQKTRFLPRLARGEDIPCFALTEPGAGSDAAAMTSSGEVFRGEDGQLYLRLNWRKRYITLAAVSTVLGLAFKLRDPDNLLGKGESLGITCALIPTSTEGVILGKRHDPLGIPFYNCPTEGKDVVVPVDAIIGGAEGAGHGWQMLMECLAAGRGISLPATSTGGAKLVCRSVGAYATVRQQFGLSIGRFEGIEEPLARIGGFTYLMDAARLFVLGGLDSGAKPPVVTAMAKYSFTELFRKLINDGMDVCGGAAISQGPNNLLATPYIGAPISITVEGANILTRTLMVFGQGAIRCHPYAFREIEALSKGDRAGFDRAFWGHVGHVVRNTFRCTLLNLSRGRLARSPVAGPTAPYWRRMAWASASFALLADMAMAGLGGDLKRKEKITGRFADVFCWMFLGTATLRRFLAEGQRREDLPFLHWSMEYSFGEMQKAFDGLYENLRLPGAGWLFRGPFAMWSRLNPIGRGPTDRQGAKVAAAIQQPGSQRDALCAGMFLPGTEERHGLARLEGAFQAVVAAEPARAKIKDAVRSGKVAKGSPTAMAEAGREAGILSDEELQLLLTAEQSRSEALEVDSFDLDEYVRRGHEAVGVLSQD